MNFFTPSGMQVHVSMSIEKKVWKIRPITVVPIPRVTTSGAKSAKPLTFFSRKPTRMRTRP